MANNNPGSVALWLDNIPFPTPTAPPDALNHIFAIMATDDPWDWDIDRVVQELCTSNRSWTPRSANALVADPVILEAALRREGISGDILLMDFDDAYLKEELDMTMKAWRTFILHAVKKLRERSAQYTSYVQEDEPQKGRSVNEKAMSRIMQGFFDQALSVRGSVAEDPQVTSNPILLPSVNASLSGPSNAAVEQEEPSNKRQKLNTIDINGDNPVVDIFALQHEDQPSLNEAQDNLPIIEDEHARSNLEGKKRKRIAPTLITSEIDPTRNREIPTNADELLKRSTVNTTPSPEPTPEPQPEPGVTFVDKDGKKRMVPILQSEPISTEPKPYNDSFQQPPGEPISTNQARLSTYTKVDCIGYLGKKSMSVNNLFYDGVAVGDEVQSEDEIEFGHAPKELPTGQRRHVNNIMKRFLRTRVKEIKRDGQSYLTVRPYSSSLIPRHQKPSFTLYCTKNGQTVARRQYETDWPELNATKSTAQTTTDELTATFNPLGPGFLEKDACNEWDPSYLEKYRFLDGGDELLPLYGESDSDNEYDYQTWKEVEKEQGTITGPLRQSNRPPLSPERVNQVIDEGIAHLITKWMAKSLPKLEKKGWRLWMKSRKRDSKHPQIIAAEKDLLHLNERLDKLRDKMLEETYTSSKQVLKQTSSLERTVFDREELLWRINTLKLKRAPDKPEVVVVTPEKTIISLEDNQNTDSDNLESVHEESSSEDGLDDFLAEEEEGDEMMQDEEEQEVPSESEDDQIVTDGHSASDSPEPIPSIEDMVVLENVQKRSISSDTMSIHGAESSAPLKKETMSVVQRNDRGKSIIEISSDEHTPKNPKQFVIDLDTPPPQLVFKKKIRVSSRQDSEVVNYDEIVSFPSQEDPFLQRPQGQKSKGAEEESDEEPVSAVRRQPRQAFNSEDLEEEATDDDFLEDENSQSTKPKYVENVEAREKRERIQNRRAEQDARRKELHFKLASQGNGNGEENGQIIVNDFATEGHYYLNAHLAKHIKKHQIKGLRFLWSSVISGSGELEGSKELDGCLLAHTMGLGKTIQAIALLVSIAESSASEDPLLVEQIPERLRNSKTLVLCPPGLIDNWNDELLSWVRPDDLLGEICKVGADMRLEERLRCISEWYASGGVLILGYEMFRHLVMNVASEKRKKPLTEEEHARVIEELIKGPNIVVADEAHRMKNIKAGVTQAANLFETKCRIALTGSPLANNIQEYHTMIDWISPNYLGAAKEFRAKFADPIQAGLWQDSNPAEKKKSRMMLRVLEKDIDAKVQRADMSVLKHDLQSKTEFTITVSLTDLQKEAYSRYVTWFLEKAHIKLAKNGDILQSTLWVYLGVLTLLCNHPSLFMAKLRESPNKPKASAKTKTLEITETDDTPEIADVDASELENSDRVSFQDLVDQEAELFASIEDTMATDLSNKIKVLLKILDAAKEAKEKTLVFSHSIPTLNYIEGIFRLQNRRYMRLDGDTKMADRQKMTKTFNDETNPTNIFIISTKAGGLGLNLPGANRVVIFDFKFNPIDEEQAIGRAYRIGQTKETFVYRLIAGGTFESIVYNTTVFKQQLASRVVDKKSQVPAAVKKASDYLFQPKEITQGDLSDLVGMDTKVLDKLLESQSGERIIQTIVQSDNFERDNDVLTAEEEALADQLHRDGKNGKLGQAFDAVNDMKASRLNHGSVPILSRAYDKVVISPQPKFEFGITGSVEAAPNRTVYMPPQRPLTVPQHSITMHERISTPKTATKKSSTSIPVRSPGLSNCPAADSMSKSDTDTAKPSVSIDTPSDTITKKVQNNSITSVPNRYPLLPPTLPVDSLQGQNSAHNPSKSERPHPGRRPESTGSMSLPISPSGKPAIFGRSLSNQSGTPSGLGAKRRNPTQPSDDDEDDEVEPEDNLKSNLYKAMSRIPTPRPSKPAPSLRTPVVDKHKRNSTSSRDSSCRKSSVTSPVKNAAVFPRLVPTWARKRIESKAHKKVDRLSLQDSGSSSSKIKRPPHT